MIREYVFPATVEAVISLLDEQEGRARIFAGGTDLVLDSAKLPISPECFVDLRDIHELDGIYEKDDCVVIGAKTTHTECASHPLIRTHVPALAQASGTVGSTQIRNVGTLAGNIVSANPAADSAVVLTALEVICTVRSKEGSREIPMTHMYEGVGRSVIDSSRELLTYIRIPIREHGNGCAYERMEQRKGLSLPMVCTAVTLEIRDGIIVKSTVVAAPLAPGPTRLADVEEYLTGREPTEEVLTEAGRLAAECVRFRSSPVRGSAEYRRQVLPVLVRRALTTAAMRTGGKKGGASCL